MNSVQARNKAASRLSVVSRDGRLVQEQRLPSLTSTASISALAAGLYHLHLSDDTRWICGTRLVVQ
ncbi:MAG: hypothetical protein R2811_08005 [Flavobacteriales bacterium]